MKREGFLKLVAGVVLAPYLGKIPTGNAQALVVPAAATTITTSGGYFRPGDILRLSATGEALRVTAVDGRTLSVDRGIGAIASQPAPVGTGIVNVGSPAYEGTALDPWEEDTLVSRVSLLVAA